MPIIFSDTHCLNLTENRLEIGNGQDEDGGTLILFNTKPDFVNESGTKFWVDKAVTSYAQKPDVLGRALPHVIVFYTEDDMGGKSYAITEFQEYLFTSQSLEEIGAHIDIMKIQRQGETE